MAKTTAQATTQSPTQAPAAAAPAVANGNARDTSNGAAQEALAGRQGRDFQAVAAGTVIESRTDVDKLTAHVGALWGQLTAAATGRASFMPETPIAGFEGTDLATDLRGVALSGELAQRGSWISAWANVGGLGVSGGEGMLNTPLATGQVEIKVLSGDAQALQQGNANVTTTAGYQAGTSETSGAEAGMGAKGVSAKLTGSETATAGTSGAAARAVSVPVTTYRGVLAFECTVRVKRVFGPAESRSGRLVAGEAVFSSALGA